MLFVLLRVDSAQIIPHIFSGPAPLESRLHVVEGHPSQGDGGPIYSREFPTGHRVQQDNVQMLSITEGEKILVHSQ